MADSFIITIITQLGFGGAIFVIWYFESKRNTKADQRITALIEELKDTHEIRKMLMDYIRQNTEVLAGLKEQVNEVKRCLND